MKTKTLFAATLLAGLTFAAMPAAAQQQPVDECSQGGIIQMLFCRGIASILKNIEQVNSPADAVNAIKQVEALNEAVGPQCAPGGPRPRPAGGHGQWGLTGFSAKRWCY